MRTKDAKAQIAKLEESEKEFQNKLTEKVNSGHENIFLKTSRNSLTLLTSTKPTRNSPHRNAQRQKRAVQKTWRND